MSSLRILIADDHEIVRQGIRAIIESHPGWEVCGEATDGYETLAKFSECNPDLVALDIGMPNLNGLDAARQILQENPKAKILFLTVYDTDAAAKTAMQIGAKGLILKSDAGKELIGAIETIQRNAVYFSAKLNHAGFGSNLRGNRRSLEKDTLTPRESQVIKLLAEGKSTKDVAAILGLSVKTAETHRSNIMSKLGLHSVSELVLYAVRNNIVQTTISEPRNSQDIRHEIQDGHQDGSHEGVHSADGSDGSVSSANSSDEADSPVSSTPEGNAA
jgi:DNA-binding NarL/FixJ family response regulator